MTTELTQKQVTSNVANRIDSMKNEGLLIASNYSVSNALSSAYYVLKNSSSGNLLAQCSSDSVYNALLEMVIQGLSPAKKQCYFIKYGTEVKLKMSYFGTMKVIKQLQDVKDIIADVVYEGDKLEIKNENGRKVLVSHETDWQNADNPIIAAYCIIERTDGEKFLTIMTKKQIDKSWSKAKTKNVQIDFPDQMAMRTVINRAAKFFINTSDDSDLFAGAINNTISEEYENDNGRKDVTPENESNSLDGLLGKTKEPNLIKDINEDTSQVDDNQQEEQEEIKNTSYPEDEIPDFDQETGEIKNVEEEPF